MSGKDPVGKRPLRLRMYDKGRFDALLKEAASDLNGKAFNLITVRPARLVWSDPTWMQDAKSTAAEAVCDACGKLLAHLTRLVKDVSWEEGDGELKVYASQVVAIGARVTLEPGFVNARTPHPLGERRWLVRGPNPARLSPVPRLPVVVACSCGRNNLLELPFRGDAAFWAQMDDTQAREAAEAESAESKRVEALEHQARSSAELLAHTRQRVEAIKARRSPDS